MYLLLITVFSMSLHGQLSIKSSTAITIKDKAACERVAEQTIQLNYFDDAPGEMHKTIATCEPWKGN